ncbi:MAG: tetratricopeptide repeat protein [Cyanobacteria bacterium J06623_5]
MARSDTQSTQSTAGTSAAGSAGEQNGGTVEAVCQRLSLWAGREEGGLARVEYASEFSRQTVLQQLASEGVEFTEIDLPASETAAEAIAFLLQSLTAASNHSTRVVSISGFSKAFQQQASLADSLRTLNFNREQITAFPLRQIWWMTPVLLDTALHAMPDMHGWFNPQLTLSQVVQKAENTSAFTLLKQSGEHLLQSNIDDARQRSRRLLDELETARASGAETLALVTTYLLPAMEAIAGTSSRLLKGLTKQYRDLLQRFYTMTNAEVLSALGGKRSLGENTLGLARNLDKLVIVFYSQGLYAEAERLCIRAIALKKSTLGDHHPDITLSLNNLAAIYSSQGRYDEADPLYQKTLSIKRAELGDRHPDTALSLNNLAALYSLQGRYSDAEPLYQQALEIRQTELGDRHPDTAASLNNLAEMYRSQGRYDEAEPLYQQALEIRQTELGGHHPDTATSLNNLASLYESQGRYNKAEPLFQQALDIRRMELGDRHPDTAISLNNLAGLYDSQARYSEAEPLFHEAIIILIQQLGLSHPNTQTVLRNFTGCIKAAIQNAQQHQLSDHSFTQKLIQSIRTNQQ